MKKSITSISIAALFILLIATLIISPSWVQALEIVRQKNVATVIVFPIQGTGGDSETGLAGMDTESDYWNDGANPDGFVDSTEPVEIGATGIYYISLSQPEMNYDYIAIQVISGSEDTFIPAQFILIRTTIGDPLNYAVTDDGTPINVASGLVESNVKQVGDSNISETVEGHLDVNVTYWEDSAISDSDGVPDVNVEEWDADAVPGATDGLPEVNVVEVGDSDITETVAGLLDVNVTYWEDSAVSDSDGQPDVDVVSMGANVITSASINDGAITDADVANDIQVDVLTIKTVDANDAIDARSQVGANAALVDENLDHLMKEAVVSNADMTAEVADGTVMSNIMSAGSDTSTYVVADDSLQGISEGAAGGGATAAQVWGYVGSRELTDFDDTGNTAVSLGATTIGTVENIPAVDVVTIETVDATDALDAHDGNPPSAATIAGAVWDEDIVGAHDGAETAGALLDSPGDWATATSIAQIEGVDATDQLDTAASTVTVTAMANNVITSASINDGAITDADVADDVTVNVKTIETVDATDALDTAANTVTVTAFAANVINDAAIDPDVDTLVNDEMKDVLATDTHTEPGQEAPPAEPTIEEMIHYLYKYFRNKIVTDANTIELYNDAGAVVDQQWSIDDDGADFTRGEAVTGP